MWCTTSWPRLRPTRSDGPEVRDKDLDVIRLSDWLEQIVAMCSLKYSRTGPGWEPSGRARNVTSTNHPPGGRGGEVGVPVGPAAGASAVDPGAGMWFQYDFGDGPRVDGVGTQLFCAWFHIVALPIVASAPTSDSMSPESL